MKAFFSALVLAGLAPFLPASAAPHADYAAPDRIESASPGSAFVDFSRSGYGWLEIKAPADAVATSVVVRVGEKLTREGRVDRSPGGSVNYRELKLDLQPGAWSRVTIPTKKPHTGANVVRMPKDIGEVTPFRAVEIEGLPFALTRDQVRRAVVFGGATSTAIFTCSEPGLVDVWNLCKWTMDATSAFGIYIDGERERLAYEADAYINQLSHYAVAPEYGLARATFEQLVAYPTWPTEWAYHMIFIAETDYRWTGDTALASKHYDVLKKKLFPERAREDGLVKGYGIIDWPAGERDSYGCGTKDPKRAGQQVGPEVNTVVNAFLISSLHRMATLAEVTGHAEDAKAFRARAALATESFQRVFWDAKQGLYRDGEGCDHASFHANMFPLAFGLVPTDKKPAVLAFLKSRGMACSVYGAQYLLDGLFENGEAEYAIGLLTATNERSWRHMIELGATMTTEAWDPKFKPNLTWNHAWGAAAGNIIARHVMGIEPAEPGFTRIQIRPQPGKLAAASLRMPTPKGDVTVAFGQAKNFSLTLDVPAGTKADVSLPRKGRVTVDGAAHAGPESLLVRDLGPGRHVLEVE